MVPVRTLAYLFLPCLLSAQGLITSAGYTSPAPIALAPGQVITLYAAGVGKALTQPVRSPEGASKSLAGLSVTLRQQTELVVPILEVRPLSTCPTGSPANAQPACGTLTAITVQIPYELTPLCPLCLRPTLFPPPWLFITENGQTSTALELTPLADQVHILTACDTLLGRPGEAPPQNVTGLRCPPMVTRPNGTLLTAANPAQPGEQLTAWAVGLGQTDPPSTTGQIVPAARPVSVRLDVDYNFRPNALPVKPGPTVNPLIFPPLFTHSAVLAQGFVGLYQLSFTLPPTPPNTPPCNTRGLYPVETNLTISFGGNFSFDGAAICVAVPTAP